MDALLLPVSYARAYGSGGYIFACGPDRVLYPFPANAVYLFADAPDSHCSDYAGALDDIQAHSAADEHFTSPANDL